MSSDASSVGTTPGLPEEQPSRFEAGGEARYSAVVWTLVAVGTVGAFQLARLRCLEFGVPMVRVGSSGISQWISATGKELATAEFPGAGAVLSGVLEIPDSPGTRPWDSWFAPLCASAGVGLGTFQFFRSLFRRLKIFIFRNHFRTKPLF